MANTGTEMSARAVTVGEGAQEGYAPALDVQPCSDMWSVPLARAGWDDLPRELHREVLRLVPLRDATAARGVSPQMRDQVDEVWRAWGIRATARDEHDAVVKQFMGVTFYVELDLGPLAVYAFEGSHAHHLASLGLWWLAMLVAEATGINGMSWAVRDLWHLDQSPLMVAVRARRPVGRGARGHLEWAHTLGAEEVARMVRAAVAMGADVNWRGESALPLMSYCAARGCLEAAKICLAAGAEVDAISDDGLSCWTAVVHAGRRGHEAVVEALLEAGASAKAGEDGQDQTLAAVCQGHPTPGIVRRLAEAGADVNAVDEGGTPAFQVAASRCKLAVMEALVDLGANWACVDSFGMNAMHAVWKGEAVRWLAAHGLSIQGDGVHSSPLQTTCRLGHTSALTTLLELGADVHDRNIDGRTPLHSAASHAQNACRLLLEAGADATAIDAQGLTPLHMVMDVECVDVLVDAGADLEARDRWGRTPI